MEKSVFDQTNEVVENINNHIHRVQFARLSLKNNKRFNKEIVQKLGVKNVKYLVYVSGKELIGGFNNEDEFEEIFEDALEGIFEEFARVNEILSKNQEIWDFLINE